ncbi:hypothetical protein ZIOFF_063347 [Zingiber officinale]|uniref:RING-type domain-containing protein n=1 Tax=Zingiber officinale TaxID=94328 RepID=A0A8J5F2D3_ZINOF|nr:hypothetical protein ZIOFF_063347 [Zingiber officinale]
MMFCKRYEEYMRGREKKLPFVGLKKLKKILKRCRGELHSRRDGGEGGKCPDNCAVCDGAFFPSLVNEMSAVCHGELKQEGKDLVAYGIINSIAMRKILKKICQGAVNLCLNQRYPLQIHFSKQGQAFRSKAPSMHIEVLQSPWLSELMAFYINLRQSTDKNTSMAELLDDCFLTFDDEETVFDPVALTCGHLLCYMCCCSAASVTIVDGLKAANCKSKCPLCRQAGVYQGAVRLDELNIFLRHRSGFERVHQTKKHWESVSREFPCCKHP